MLDSKAPAPALAPKAKRASPEELKAKIAAYISNLLQNLSRIAETADSPAQEALLKEQTSNLRSLINHPRSEEFLFEPFLVDGSLLFVHLLTLNNPRLSDLAFRTLIPQKPHLISRIAQPATFLLQAKIEPFFPTVFYLFSTHNGTRAILLLLAQNKNLIEIVTPELLYKKVNGISAFFNLASFPKGQEYLLYLFSEKPSLIASLSEEDLYQAPSELEDDYTNSSPFFWCCSSGSSVPNWSGR